MKVAEAYINNRWIPVRASECSESIRNFPIRCICCHAPAIFCSGEKIDPYFKSNLHSPECGMAIGGRTFHVAYGYCIKLKDVLDAKDGPYMAPQPNPEGPGEPLQATQPKENDSPDNITISGPAACRSCSRIYCAVKGMSLTDYVTPDLTVEEFLVDDTTIQYHRNNGLSGIHLMVGVRFNIGAMDPPLPENDGYIYLRDPSSWGRRDAIYYRIRWKEPTQHTHNRIEILSRRNMRRLFIFIGRVRRIPHDTYTIYEVSPLAKARFCIGRRVADAAR